MKNLIIGLFLLSVLTACTNMEETDPENLRENLSAEQNLQKWKLVEMSGNVANVPPSTGSSMAWQEYYELRPDHTFVKSREQDSGVIEETGTYAFVTLPDGEYLELTYDADNDLIGNCTSDSKELLFLQAENKLIGTWQACDGPGLVYEKVE